MTGIRVDRRTHDRRRTTRGPIDTPVVVNAAGPHARPIGRLAGVDVPVDPYRRHIFIAAFDRPATPGAPVRVPASKIMVIDFETTFYFHREGAGLLFGMGDPHEASTFDTTVRWDFLPEVTEAAVQRLPALADASISHAWAGLYEMSPDANPIIGAAPARPACSCSTVSAATASSTRPRPAAFSRTSSPAAIRTSTSRRSRSSASP